MQLFVFVWCSDLCMHICRYDCFLKESLIWQSSQMFCWCLDGLDLALELNDRRFSASGICAQSRVPKWVMVVEVSHNYAIDVVLVQEVADVSE